MSESSLVDKFELADGEQVVLKWEDSVKVLGRTGGLIGKKFLVGGETGVPCLVLLTDRRIVLLAEYSTQSGVRVAIVARIPLGKKKSHTIYGDFSFQYLDGMKLGFMGGCEMTFNSHNGLKSQHPKFKQFTLYFENITKKAAKAIQEEAANMKKQATATQCAAGSLELT